MNVKILCACGAKYSFDVEPVDGRMPFTVQCPTCQLDGTAAANQIIAQSAAAAPAPKSALRIHLAHPEAAAAAPETAPVEMCHKHH